jgi:hypothetical protein
MKQIFVSNYGDDNNHGLGRSAPVKSRKRLYELCRGDTEMVLIEGSAILERLMTEALGTGPDATGETWAQTSSQDTEGNMPPRGR